MSAPSTDFFILTNDIANGIIFAMEDQNTESFVDSATGLVHGVDAVSEDADVLACRLPLPVWTPADGFRLMADFTASLQNPIAAASLSTVLNGGHGVFRRFKDTLATFPALEQKWFAFKDETMHRIVRNWYDALREARGLEKMGVEPEETDDIIDSDFVFTWLLSSQAEIDVSRLRDMLNDEITSGSPAGSMVCAAYRKLQGADSVSEFLTATDGSGSIIAYLAVCRYPTFSGKNDDTDAACFDKSVATMKMACITECFVCQEFRGMGIATALLDRCIRWCTCNDVTHLGIVPPFDNAVARHLEKRGFSASGPLYVIQL